MLAARRLVDCRESVRVLMINISFCFIDNVAFRADTQRDIFPPICSVIDCSGDNNFYEEYMYCITVFF